MKILIDMGHPAHVHLFKNFIWEMQKRGHEFKITARDKDVTKQLLDAYKIPFELIGKMQNGRLNLYFEWISRLIQIYKIGKRFNADFYIGVANPATAISACLNKKISITFTDTEFASLANFLTIPFSNSVLTSSQFKKDFGSKHIRYNSSHEFAYLNPKYFTPNPEVLKLIDAKIGDNLFILRFAALNASHDNYCEGFKPDFITLLIQKLEAKGRVIIFSEKKIPDYLQMYAISIPPQVYHDIIYYSKLYIGESSTTAEEAAILGTPSIYFERWRINGKICGSTAYVGILDELENSFGLLYSFYDENELIKKVDELLIDIELHKKEWENKRIRFIKEKIDLTKFLSWFIEDYPQSHITMKKNPNIQYRFI